ncbi:9472_t:CDS:1 [Acaulospora morrowiae]|uniref:9472_t:CDS:1 n=1 Tax=Acaulospora morrowiae TaxID=94023 RepID=A0A9N8WKP2_9GLOM|nr:9472_t:CDS:1 [Acaulospora morrowiae]
MKKNESSVVEGKRQGSFEFHRDWLTDHLPHWEKRLGHLTQQEINVLEIGAFEGRSTTWILLELCKNPRSKLITIDTFERIFEKIDNEKIFHENIRKTGRERQIEIVKSRSYDALIQLNQKKEIMFDFIYIDGSHIACDVLSDIVLSWSLLKENGILILDDYQWGFFKEEHNNPKMAIDAFMKCYQWQIEVLDMYYQVIIRKVTRENVGTIAEGKDWRTDC